MSQPVRIGNASGFWGDRPEAAAEMLAREPDLDYLTLDYLAEVSMSILATQRERDPHAGYAADFVDVVRSLAPYWKSGGRCRVITNAGGLNPAGCADACAKALQEEGCRPLRIAIISGDDVLPLSDQLILPPLPREQPSTQSEPHRGRGVGGEGETQTVAHHLPSPQPSPAISPSTQSARLARERGTRLTPPPPLLTANAYLGAAPIVAALAQHADIIITGRVADPSLTVAPCIHHHGWSDADYGRIAGATVAGHLIECGAQVTGGISTDWLDIPDPAHIGFPIVEVTDDGSCIVTKPHGTGGRVDALTVKEQLVYEIGDPARYLSPDCTVSFLGLQVTDQGDNRVHVAGAIGSTPPDTLKVSATYRDGWRAAGTLTIIGADAAAKAQRTGEIILQRVAEAGHMLRGNVIEVLGAPQRAAGFNPAAHQNVVLRIAVESDSRPAVECFTRQLMPLLTAGPPGTTGYAEGRPKVRPVIRYLPRLIDRAHVTPTIEIRDVPPVGRPSKAGQSRSSPPAHTTRTTASAKETRATTAPTAEAVPHNVDPQSSILDPQSPRAPHRGLTPPGSPGRTLADIAVARSGDKGTSANVGVIARRPEDYALLRDQLTPQRVADWFADRGLAAVDRYELPNLQALNFILHDILSNNLRTDAQGKALAQQLLMMPFP